MQFTREMNKVVSKMFKLMDFFERGLSNHIKHYEIYLILITNDNLLEYGYSLKSARLSLIIKHDKVETITSFFKYIGLNHDINKLPTRRFYIDFLTDTLIYDTDYHIDVIIDNKTLNVLQEAKIR